MVTYVVFRDARRGQSSARPPITGMENVRALALLLGDILCTVGCDEGQWWTKRSTTRNTERGRQDKQAGMSFDRNRPSTFTNRRELNP